MLARALRTPLRNAARAVAPTAVRTFATAPGDHLKEIKDVKLKDVPAWVSETQSDPRTEQAAKVCGWLSRRSRAYAPKLEFFSVFTSQYYVRHAV